MDLPAIREQIQKLQNDLDMQTMLYSKSIQHEKKSEDIMVLYKNLKKTHSELMEKLQYFGTVLDSTL